MGSPLPPRATPLLRQGQDRRRVAQAGTDSLPPRWSGASSPTRSGADSSANRCAQASDAATPAPNAPTPSASPKTTGLPAQATSSKWTRSTSAPPMRDPQAFHRQRHRLPLRRLASGNTRQRRERRAVPRRHRGAHAVPVKAIQVDGGSEFQGEFEEACRERGILLFGAAAAFADVERVRGARGAGRAWRSSSTSTTGS